MMSWQLFTPSCDRFAAWPHHHVQASSVWCVVPHPAPVFLLALTATQAPSSNPSCCLDHLQMPVLLFCLPERGRYNYPSLPCCLGAWWRHRLDMLRATRPSSCSLRLWGTLGLRFWGRVEESRQIINRNYFNPMKKMQWQKKPVTWSPVENITTGIQLAWNDVHLFQTWLILTFLSANKPQRLHPPQRSVCFPSRLGMPQAAKEVKKVNKSVIKYLTLCISTAKEREMPFILKADLSLLEPWFLKHIFHSARIHQLHMRLSRPPSQGLCGAQLLPPQELLLSAVTQQHEGSGLCHSSSPAASGSSGLVLSPGRLRVPMSDALLTGSAN